MAKLIYTAITSLDGYVEDKQGKFDWAMPDEEVHAFVNELERPIGIHLYGRRMYETMKAWDSDEQAHKALKLLGHRSFTNGTIYLHYKICCS